MKELLARFNNVSSSSVRFLLLAFFLISGACGLIYQVAWLRVLGLIFGNTTFATSTVVAGFMAGLGVGALYFGRKIDDRKDPIRVYGILEGGVALYSFLTPFLWKLIEVGYVHYYRIFDPSFFHFSLVKFVLSFSALLLPTFLMGGTLPVLSKYFVRRDEEVARDVGLLYAWNTFGAVLGVLVSGFFALYVLGVWQSVYLAGFLNFIICFACMKLLSPSADNQEVSKVGESANASLTDQNEEEADSNKGSRTVLHAILLILFAVSGAISMVYEIAWTRVLAIVLGSSVYAFSVMLATFLVGIALGSFLLSRFSPYLKIDLKLFSILQVLTAFFVFASLNQFNEIPFYFVKIFEWTGGGVWAMELGKFLLCALIMLAPTLLIGALFACFIHIYHHTASLGKEIGVAYFSNTVGNIMGAFFTGFFIIPRLGIQNTLISAAWVSVAVAIVAFALSLKQTQWPKTVSFSLAVLLVFLSAGQVHPWDKAVITSGAMVKPHMAKGMDKEKFLQTLHARHTLFYQEGSSATVNVTQQRGNLSMAVNGKVDASNSHDALNQFVLGHLPFMYRPDAKKVMIIGLGSGSTAAAAASHDTELIEVAEIEEAVVRASKYFSDLNRNVLEDPRVRVVVNDGRNHLLTTKHEYDVIISEPSNPWMAGVANLFSREYYEMVRDRMDEEGILCQWLHAYSMSKEDLKMILRTFLEVFPEATLWMSNYPDLILIGQKTPKPIQVEDVEKAFQNPEVRADFANYGVLNPYMFFSLFWLDAEALAEASYDGKINKDNRPHLEFSAPRNLFKNTLKSNFVFLNKYRNQSKIPVAGLDPPVENNARLHSEMALGFIRLKMFEEAQYHLARAREIDPNNAWFHQGVGILLFNQNNYEGAAGHLGTAIQLNPELSLAHYYLGLIYREEGMLPQAIYEFDRAITLDDKNPVFYKAIGDAFGDAKRYGAALQAYDRFLKFESLDFETYNKMADIIYESAELPQQLMISKVLLEKFPHDPSVYEKIAKHYESSNQINLAHQIYDAMIKQFPGEASGYLLKARLYGISGKQAEAFRVLDMAVRDYPKLRETAEIKSILEQRR